MTPRERHREAVFARDDAKCALADGACDGRLQADHILRVQVIKRRRDELLRWIAKGYPLDPGQRRLCDTDMDELIADGRNGQILCERHHGVKDRKLAIVPGDQLPDHFHDFIGDYGLEAAAEREGLKRKVTGWLRR